MSQKEYPQVWIVKPNGRFVPNGLGDEDEGLSENKVDELLILEGGPEAICPYCKHPIQRGELTVPLTRWGNMYEDQTEDYPLHGLVQQAHLRCLIKVFQGKKNAKP